MDIPYATPSATPRSSKNWAAALLILGALGLIFLAGCFLIGVMFLVAPEALGILKASPLTPASYGLLITLYVLAFACITGAVLMLYLAIRTLVRIGTS